MASSERLKVRLLRLVNRQRREFLFLRVTVSKVKGKNDRKQKPKISASATSILLPLSCCPKTTTTHAGIEPFRKKLSYHLSTFRMHQYFIVSCSQLTAKIRKDRVPYEDQRNSLPTTLLQIWWLLMLNKFYTLKRLSISQRFKEEHIQK